MIKQDYLIRMIQEIVSLIVNALLRKKKYRWSEWVEYDDLTRQILGFPSDQLLSMDSEELIDRYKGDPNEMGKTELAAMTMLKISDEMGDDDLLRKSKLRQDGLNLLRYVQKNSSSFSIQRVQLIDMLEANE
ncbi:hypothetical protein [uncultured Bacteroides sp.]|uniref:hypothetical protein n=1 Tax=uncultured Bacteroides sp. TaxID=162156 RepID=UPI0025F38C70|nr:hypothetical protein [uncultured Bacteroides sp.]